MYGAAKSFGFGVAEPVFSLKSLVESIKRFQLLRPRCKLALKIDDTQIPVTLLPSGHIELDGQVQPVSVERDIEDAIAQFGAVLQEIPGQ